MDGDNAAETEHIFNNVSALIKGNNIVEAKKIFFSLITRNGKIETEKGGDAGKEDIDEVLKNKTVEFIENNYRYDISRDDVANHIYLNAAYFSRWFKKHFGLSYSDYLLELRIKKSIRFLSENYGVTEIYKKVGFNYNRYFIKNFQKLTSYTPEEYRRQVLKIDDGDDDYE
jgi:two-component system response regulator YesN